MTQGHLLITFFFAIIGSWWYLAAIYILILCALVGNFLHATHLGRPMLLHAGTHSRWCARVCRLHYYNFLRYAAADLAVVNARYWYGDALRRPSNTRLWYHEYFASREGCMMIQSANTICAMLCTRAIYYWYWWRITMLGWCMMICWCRQLDCQALNEWYKNVSLKAFVPTLFRRDKIIIFPTTTQCHSHSYVYSNNMENKCLNIFKLPVHAAYLALAASGFTLYYLALRHTSKNYSFFYYHWRIYHAARSAMSMTKLLPSSHISSVLDNAASTHHLRRLIRQIS